MENNKTYVKEIKTLSIEEQIKQRYRDAFKKGQVINLCGYTNITGKKRKSIGKLPIAKRRKIDYSLF